MRILSSELKNHAGSTVTIAGWLHKKRLLGGVNFIIVRDRGGLAQVLIKDAKTAELLEGLQNGSILEITGKIVEDDRSIGGAELHEPKVKVLVPVDQVMPIEIDKPISHQAEHLDSLFEHRVIGLRNLKEQKIFTVAAAVESAIRRYFEANNFVNIHTPKLLATATEGGAEVFKLDYFDRQATLAQSPQFYKQIMVGVYERVYEIGPVYRAEPSTTTRHMSEYISVDAEVGFVSGAEEIMEMLGALLHSVIDDVWQTHQSDLKDLKAEKPKLKAKIPSISLEELHELYYKKTGQDTRAEKDPIPAEERFASEYALEKWGSEAVFITGFPASEMKFYHQKDAKNPKLADRFDLIFRGVEIVTGSMREHRLDVLLAQLKESGGKLDDLGYKYYLQAFEYGMPPHGGFGLGLERLVQKLIGLRNVKEAALFPRDMGRLTP